MGSLFWLTDTQMARLEPLSPGRPHVDNRRILGGITFISHKGYEGEMHRPAQDPLQPLEVVETKGSSIE